MATVKVTWHPDAIDKALATLIKAHDEMWALRDGYGTIPPQEARVRLNRIGDDLLAGDTLACAIDAIRAHRSDG